MHKWDQFFVGLIKAIAFISRFILQYFVTMCINYSQKRV